MAKINKSIEIKAPAEKVFAYAANPMATPEWIVGMMEVSDVIGSGEGMRFSWKSRNASI